MARLPELLPEAKARVVTRDDLPMLVSTPKIDWAASTIMRKRVDFGFNGSGHKTNPDFIVAALLDIKVARKGRDALVLRPRSQISDQLGQQDPRQIGEPVVYGSMSLERNSASLRSHRVDLDTQVFMKSEGDPPVPYHIELIWNHFLH